jgi:ABC-type polysaccharide/polyol phosphate transport system ATPase subunit
MIDLKFDHVSKRYLVRQEMDGEVSSHRLVRKLQSLRRRATTFWAVRDVSFEVQRGEALGIIGHNGAGKSTILKLLSNITTPTSGEITINGRLSALIEVGSGFHPELTGRENVYLNGSILGMRRREITKKLDGIVDFAGVRQFIDTPVKRYSSGMYVRLGFSIAAFLDPDILLLDEVLAVGDAAFQAKCLQRIGELKQTGTTIIFISHDLGAVERLCDRVLLMRQGEIVASGLPHDVITQYQNNVTGFAPPGPLGKRRPRTDGPREVEITSLVLSDTEGQTTSNFRTGEPFTARVEYTAHKEVRDAVFEIFFTSGYGDLQCQFTTELSGERIDLQPGRGAVEFSCAELGLQPNIYDVHLLVKERGLTDGIDWRPHCGKFRVDPGKIVEGRFFLSHDWRCVEQSAAVDKASTETPLGAFASRT